MWPLASIAGDRVATTPAFDSLARRGVMFTNAYVAAPSCPRSRAAMLTGQWHWRLEEGANLLGPRCWRSCWKTVRDVPGVRIAVWPGEELWQQPGPVGPPDWRLANRQYRYLRRW